MIIHIAFKDGSRRDVSTHRVTFNPHRFPRFLCAGTVEEPNFTYWNFSVIEWFWIEENEEKAQE